jgi:spermidine synthase
LLKLGQIQSAIEQYYKILQLKPDDLEVLNNLAWLLATVEDTRFQNPNDAVKFAQRACELAEPANQPAFLDTLAAAYAAAGNFPEAVKAAERAVELAEAAGKKDLVLEIQKRLELYKAGQPYRQK